MHFHRISVCVMAVGTECFLLQKKWDESGNVTHVCKIREELRRFCIKIKIR